MTGGNVKESADFVNRLIKTVNLYMDDSVNVLVLSVAKTMPVMFRTNVING